MNLIDILYTVRTIAKGFTKNLELPLEEFNHLLRLAQDELFVEMVSGYLSGNGTEVSAKVAAFEHTFKWVTTQTSFTASTKYGVSSQTINMLTTEYIFITAWVYDNAADYPDKVTKVDIVTPLEAIERLNNSITYPSTDYPILVMDKSAAGTTLYADIIPNGWTAIKLFTIRKPTTTPQLILVDDANGYYTQSGSSVDLEVPAIFHVDIIRKILKYLGMMVGDQQIVQVTEQQKLNEK